MTSASWADVQARSEAAYHWLKHTAWPLWVEHGIDRQQGAFHEHLHHDTLACRASFRRLRVVCRQIYCFSHAAMHGVNGAAEAVNIGLAYLKGIAYLAPGQYGWRYDLKGELLDGRIDLYDHSFVLLALTTAHRLLGRSELMTEADAVYDLIERRLRHDRAGFLESLPPALPRRQNPHMHLLEALLAATEVFSSPRYFSAAQDLVGFVLDHLFDHTNGSMPEFFSDDLTVKREEGRYVVEPGHHAEWVWLLAWCERSAARFGVAPHPRSGSVSQAMAAFVDLHGIDEVSGTLIDETWSDGTSKLSSSRLWPQTERLKFEMMRADAEPLKILSAYDALDLYLSRARPGLWAEHRTAEGCLTFAACPASSLYHLTCGILEAHAYASRMTTDASSLA